MMDGTAIKDIFYLIPGDVFKTTTLPTLDLPPSKTRECCGQTSFKALADINSDDEFKNDTKNFLWWFDDIVSEVNLTLMKFSDTTGDYEDTAVLDGTIDLGTFYNLGFFTNSFGENFVGYGIEWKKVLTTYGIGSYKVKLEAETSLGDTATIYSDEYCLKPYTPQRANGTVKIEYTLNSLIGDNSDDLNRRDFVNLNWTDSIRWEGYFSYVKSTYENDYTRYNNGARKWVKDEQEPEYKLLLKSAPWKVHELMRTDILQADEILITDYNTNNVTSWIKKSVQKTSEYPPKFFNNKSKLASVEITFRQAINNLKKLRS